MAIPVFNRERAARILVDAIAFGDNKTAARRWKVTEKTIGRYRARLANDPKWSKLVCTILKQLGGEHGSVSKEMLPGKTGVQEITTSFSG